MAFVILTTYSTVCVCWPIWCDSLQKATVPPHRLLFALVSQSTTLVKRWCFSRSFQLKTLSNILWKRQWSSLLPYCRSPKLPQAISEIPHIQNINQNKFGKHNEHLKMVTLAHEGIQILSLSWSNIANIENVNIENLDSNTHHYLTKIISYCLLQ